MVNIGFIGCHEISFHCLKKICGLANEFDDTISLVFDLLPEEALKHSASISLESLKNEYDCVSWFFLLLKISFKYGVFPEPCFCQHNLHSLINPVGTQILSFSFLEIYFLFW